MPREISNLTQKQVDSYFIEACIFAKLDTIKALHAAYPPEKKNSIKFLHKAFLKIFKIKTEKPVLNIHTHNNLGLRRICEQGNLEIIKFLVSLPEFNPCASADSLAYAEPKSSGITEHLIRAVSNHHFEVAEILFPILEKHINGNSQKIVAQLKESLHVDLYACFIDACIMDDVNVIEYLCSKELLDIKKYKTKDADKVKGITYAKPENTVIPFSHKGFAMACESNSLDVIEYFINSPEFKEMQKFEELILVDNMETLKHLVINLHIDRNHPIVQRITYQPVEEFYKLFEIRELHENLDEQLNQNDKHNSVKTKKPKI